MLTEICKNCKNMSKSANTQWKKFDFSLQTSMKNEIWVKFWVEVEERLWKGSQRIRSTSRYHFLTETEPIQFNLNKWWEKIPPKPFFTQNFHANLCNMKIPQKMLQKTDIGTK